jgi:hypothetical protein
MKVYVSGPMTGIADFNFPAFEEACVSLRALGYEVVSPHEVNPADGIEHPWDWYMRRDIVALMEADAIVTLPGWLDSKGATLETHIGRTLGMRVLYLPAALRAALDEPTP